MKDFESKVGRLTAPAIRELLGVMVAVVDQQSGSLMGIWTQGGTLMP
jgi:hypothetical protein